MYVPIVHLNVSDVHLGYNFSNESMFGKCLLLIMIATINNYC